MSMSLFQNHKGPLLFAGAMIGFAALFAESQPVSDKSREAAHQPKIVEEQAKNSALTNSVAPADSQTDEELAAAGWATDDDLMDDTVGFDPEPLIDGSPDRSAAPDLNTKPDSERPATVTVTQADGPPPSSSSRSYRDNSDGPRMVPGKPSSSGGGQPIIPISGA